MNRSKLIGVFSALALASLPPLLAAPNRHARARCRELRGINYAHRGLHNADKTVPENSLRAFRLASQAGYGIELDVHLTRDGQVVVFHDDTLERVCGVEGRLEDLSYSELKELRLCGTEERIPLLSEVLESIDGCAALIVELKQGHNRDELCQKTYDLLKTYSGRVCIESFDPFYVAWFKKHAPEVVRGQLAMPAAEYAPVLSGAKAFIASRCMLNFHARPDFIAYKIGPRPLLVRLSELMGAVKFGWTSLSPENEKHRDGVIFQFYSPKVRFK